MLLKNTSVFAISAILKGLIGFTLIAVFTRMLSPADFGLYAVIVAIITIADTAGFLWLRHTLMRHITDEKTAKDESILSNAFIIYMLVTVIFCATAVLASYPLVALIIAADSLSNLVILLARLRLNRWLFLWLSVGKPLIAMLAGVFLMLAGHGVSGALCGMALGFSLIAAAGLWTLPDIRKARPSMISRPALKSILAFGLPLIAVLSLQLITRATDRLLLDLLLGADITGLYAAAQDIPYKLLTVLLSSLHFALYPLALKAFDQGTEACRKQLAQNLILLFALLCPAAIGIALLSSGIADMLLGSEFRPLAATYIPVFAGIAALSCLIQYYCILPFHLKGETKRLVLPFVTALAINAGIGLTAIPYIGVKGAILGSFLSYLFLITATLIMGRRLMPLPFPAIPLIKIIIATLVMTGVLSLYDFGFVISVIIGIMTYTAVTLALTPSLLKKHLWKSI